MSSLQLRSRSRAPSSAHRPPTAPLSAPSQPGGRAEAADASGVRLTGRLGAVAVEHDGDPHEDLVGVRVGVRGRVGVRVRGRVGGRVGIRVGVSA